VLEPDEDGGSFGGGSFGGGSFGGGMGAPSGSLNSAMSTNLLVL